MITNKDIKRFFNKVKKTDNCWSWLASSNGRGYGEFSWQSKKHYAHRWSYYYHYNIEPGELLVCHKCDNPSCVNPEHLFLGTYLDNNRDCKAKGRNKSLKGKCSKGHSVSGNNKGIHKQGHSYCKICNRQRRLKSYYKNLNEV